MANTEKRVLGDYKITTDAGSTGNVSIDTHTLTVDGNLVIMLLCLTKAKQEQV